MLCIDSKLILCLIHLCYQSSFNFVIFSRLNVRLVKKKLRIIFLNELKLDPNAAQTARNAVEAWGEGSASERTVRRYFEKFCSEDASLEDEEGRGRLPIVDNDRLKTNIEANFRKTAHGIVKHTYFVGHSNQLGTVKALDKWIPLELDENQRIVVMECPIRCFYETKAIPISIEL